HFPNLSTVRMTEFAAHIVYFLWLSPSTTISDQSFNRSPLSSDLKDVFSNIFLNLELPTVTIVLALKYMYRIRISLSTSTLDLGNLTKLFVTSLLLTTKYHLDCNIRNSEWSSKVGIRTDELSRMERWMLRELRYDLGITVEDFLAWAK
ncbi:hypothetical protein K493DRAFT_179039, partial [Basidiobolus meristosporus CBS 931.73]